ncbi:hypothetical protein FHU29_001741 [Hoyosella altamirensis]|uniref:Uncharacterized protein n=1 Tax=Hoyosella altamirensis TaxID=616997 RepID=A0A839RLP0_9ACTN|nr:hypothetical protein [Hoyosella altamirensis]
MNPPGNASFDASEDLRMVINELAREFEDEAAPTFLERLRRFFLPCYGARANASDAIDSPPMGRNWSA